MYDKVSWEPVSFKKMQCFRISKLVFVPRLFIGRSLKKPPTFKSLLVFLLSQTNTSCQEAVWILAIFTSYCLMNRHLDNTLKTLTPFALPRSDNGSWHPWSKLSESNSTILLLIGPLNRARKLPTHYSKNSNNAFWKRISRVFKCASSPQLWKLLHWCQAARLVCRRREPAQPWWGGVQHGWHKLKWGENSEWFHVSKHS